MLSPDYSGVFSTSSSSGLRPPLIALRATVRIRSASAPLSLRATSTSRGVLTLTKTALSASLWRDGDVVGRLEFAPFPHSNFLRPNYDPHRNPSSSASPRAASTAFRSRKASSGGDAACGDGDRAGNTGNTRVYTGHPMSSGGTMSGGIGSGATAPAFEYDPEPDEYALAFIPFSAMRSIPGLGTPASPSPAANTSSASTPGAKQRWVVEIRRGRSFEACGLMLDYVFPRPGRMPVDGIRNWILPEGASGNGNGNGGNAERKEEGGDEDDGTVMFRTPWDPQPGPHPLPGPRPATSSGCKYYDVECTPAEAVQLWQALDALLEEIEQSYAPPEGLATLRRGPDWPALATGRARGKKREK